MTDEETESSEQEGGGDETAMRQQWMTERQQAMLEARKGKQKDGGVSDAAEKAKQMADRMAKLQKAWRVFNATTGLISIADLGLTLFITWLSMNGQLILGNGFKVKYVPPLTFPEILILALVDATVAILLMIVVALIVIIADCSGVINLIGCAAKLVI